MGGFANNAPIVTDGLVFYVDAGNDLSYPDTGTTWTDLVGSNDATLNNGPTYDSANGGSIVFDGADDYTQFNQSLSLSEATFIAWIKRDGQQGSWAGILFSRGGGGQTTGLGYRNNTNQIGYHWRDASSTYSWSSGLTAPDGEWCMAVLSVSSTAATAYLCQESGITSATNSVSHAPTTLGNLVIGRDPHGAGRSMSGNCAIGQIYNKALSAAEIAQNYNALKNRFV
tara:strand:+ start:166 stop:846 length:681 start_codon:yes stop_codon:yes gene_type:complete